MTMKEETRHREELDALRSDGQNVDAYGVPQSTTDSSISPQRMRVQQQCRDYWVTTYGREAEFASRGGVTWIGGGSD